MFCPQPQRPQKAQAWRTGGKEGLVRMLLDNQTPYEAELIHGPNGPEDHGTALIIKKTLPLHPKITPGFVWPVSLQELKTELAVFPFDHHFPTAKMDVMVCGFAFAPGGRATREMHVSLSIGQFHYNQTILGNRKWKKRAFGYKYTDPEPFTQMPLTLQNAFGGKSPHEGGDIACLDNPEGKGFILKGVEAEGIHLPNIERPDQRIKSPKDQPPTTCMAPYPFSGKLRYEPLMVDGKMKDFAGEDSHLYFGQAHPDLMMDRLEPGTMLCLHGMHPQHDLKVIVPENKLEAVVSINGKEELLPITLDGLCIFAHENCFGLKYRAAGSFKLEPRQKRKVILREVSS
ncbi:MAG: hypothetical protein CR997_10255 [Acidobacteria bacterium]|nr:MAG: hypothetical protein CR997_10255 [Acidobacteriota bacterium]